MYIDWLQTASSFSFGNYIKSDGVNDYGSFTDTDFGTVHSIEFWIRTTDTFGMILSRTLGGNYYVFSNGSGVLEYRSTGTTTQVTSFNFQDGAWHHISITRNGTALRFYLDGSNVGGTKTLPNNASFLQNRFCQYGNNSNFMAADIDEMRIYGNYTMSDSEVLGQYNSGLGASVLVKTPHAADIFWSFNESNSSTTVADSSGNNKTLTLSNYNYDANSGFFLH